MGPWIHKENLESTSKKINKTSLENIIEFSFYIVQVTSKKTPKIKEIISLNLK